MKNYRLIISFFLIFIFFLPTQSSQKTTLNQLFNELFKVNNYKDAIIIEKKIWSIWHEHPQNIELTEKLKLGSQLMNQGSYNYALKVFDNIIKTDPEWSEGWNKRATLLFIMKEYEKSLHDIEKVLALESRHFGALSGQGLVQTKLKNYEKAIESYQAVQKIYPSIRAAKIMIPQLKKLIKENAI